MKQLPRAVWSKRVFEEEEGRPHAKAVSVQTVILGNFWQLKVYELEARPPSYRSKFVGEVQVIEHYSGMETPLRMMQTNTCETEEQAKSWALLFVINKTQETQLALFSLLDQQASTTLGGYSFTLSDIIK